MTTITRYVNIEDMLEDISASFNRRVCMDDDGEIDRKELESLKTKIMEYLCIEHPDIVKQAKEEIVRTLHINPQYRVMINYGKADVYVGIKSRDPIGQNVIELAYVDSIDSKLLNQIGFESAFFHGRIH